MSGFDPEHFNDFTRALQINSKEYGVIRLGHALLGTQRRFLQEMQIGIAMGVREFVTLKCRQIGISTISLALDLYWASEYPGLGGALVVHDDAARDQFRATIDMYRDGLPREWFVEEVQHNRNQLVLRNGSILQYKVAGTTERKTKSLGRSAALAFLHATEVAFWADAGQISGLKSTMAELNPDRFAHWETTANGYNHFNDMWEEAKKAVTQRAIFITWWSNELYRAKRDGLKWRTYWGKAGRASAEEREWMAEAKTLYGVEIDDEQLAWFRWVRAEKVTDEMDLYQEFPPTENYAFVATGSAFFTGQQLSDAYQRVTHEAKPEHYRMHVTADFTETRVLDCPERIATLRIWEEPVKEGFYVIGADPAYGSSDVADRFAISVWRSWGNRLEQSAEFCTVEMTTYAFAWVIVYLAGAYQPCILNVELGGPGEAVLNEIQNLKKMGNNAFSVSEAKTIRNVVAKMQQYLYRRLDTIGGMPTALHTITTPRTKDSMMNTFRDYFERGVAVPHSRALLDEMKKITREGGREPAAAKGYKDDRVMAAVLATKCWNDQLRTRLIRMSSIWVPPEKRIITEDAAQPVLARTVDGYLTQIGVKVRADLEKHSTRTYVPK